VFLILISQGIYLVIIIFSWWIMFGGLFGGVLEWFEILGGLRD